MILKTAKNEDDKNLWLPSTDAKVTVGLDGLGMRVVTISGLLDGYMVSMGGLTAINLAVQIEHALRDFDGEEK